MLRPAGTYRHTARATLIAGLLAWTSVAPARADESRIIDRAEYATRLRAFWMGETIASWTGLRTEGRSTVPPFLTDADWGTFPYPAFNFVFLDIYTWGNPWVTHDDTDIEYVYLHAMSTLGGGGVNRLTPNQIAGQWTDHINRYIWASDANARALMGIGVRPPMTALAQGLDPIASFDSSLLIDAQMTTEFFGFLCPGMPERALAMGDLPIRTIGRGYSAHAAQFHVVLYALAPLVDRTKPGRDQAIWLVKEARKYIPDTSKSADAIDFVLADFLAKPDINDWESTRDRVCMRYQGNPEVHGFFYRGDGESTINLAAGVMALLYGHMNFDRTVQVGTLAGWDSDNPTATMGGLVAFVQGQAFLDQYSWVCDNYWVTSTRDNLPDYTPGLPSTDGDDTFTLMGRRMLPIIDREVLVAGGRTVVGATPTPSGTWILPSGGAGAGVTKPIALSRVPTQQEFGRSANWRVRLAGGTVSPSISVPGAPEAGFGSASVALIADGQESDWRGLEEIGSPRGYCSTQRAGGNPPTTAQAFTVAYDRSVKVHTIRFIGGRHFTTGTPTGGWFQNVTPQVLVGGQWVTPTLASAGVPAPGEPFAILDFVLGAPVQAMAIRVSGLPGGSGAFVTCMELDALAAPPTVAMPTFDRNHDGSLTIDDLYAWAIAPADLNADGIADERDLLYLEQAIRLGETAGMAVHR